jgi:hypothetical protein
MTEQNKTTTIPLPVQGKDMDSIMQSLESGVEELFTSNRYQEFLKTMAKFHNYSFDHQTLHSFIITSVFQIKANTFQSMHTF